MWNTTSNVYYRVPFIVTCVVTSACVTVSVTCPARAYAAFVTWYLILSRVQKKWFTRARKWKVWQQKLLSRILWEEITTTKKHLSSLRIPTTVSCSRLHENLNYNSLEKYLFLAFPQPLNLNRTTNAGIRGVDGRARAEFIVMITLFTSNLNTIIWNSQTTSLDISNPITQQISVVTKGMVKLQPFFVPLLS